MKTKLLKKLRKQAFKEIGVYSYYAYGEYFYVVAYRKEFGSNYSEKTNNLPEVSRMLNNSRRGYILRALSDLKLKKLNKKLAKL